MTLKLEPGRWGQIRPIPYGKYPELEKHEGHWAHLQNKEGDAWVVKCRCGTELQVDATCFNIMRLQEPPKALLTLGECLLDAWEYPIPKVSGEGRLDYSFEAENFFKKRGKVTWANREGLARLAQIDPHWNEWSATRKSGRFGCAMGHELYGLYYRPPGWEGLRFCPACMALLLYFNKAHQLPPAYYSAWDSERGEGVR